MKWRPDKGKFFDLWEDSIERGDVCAGHETRLGDAKDREMQRSGENSVA